MIQNANNLNYGGVITYLIEFRTRLLRVLLVLFVVFALLMSFANNLYALLALPFLKLLPQGHLIATEIISPFFVPVKLAFMVAIFITMPYFLYQLWVFISPALYRRERKLIWPFLVMSIFLFYGGVAFAYFAVFPMLFHFLIQVAPRGVMLSPDISEYLDFTIKLILVFGCLFEIPMLMALLTAAAIVPYEKFIRARSYAIVSAFILAMLLAPPDVLSQTLLALPIWLLYEIGILLARLIGGRASPR